MAPKLSGRQAEVLLLVAQGLTNQAIADQLEIRKSTVDTHVDQVKAALKARNRAHAVYLAMTLGLIRSATCPN